jgi:4-diphosphocytidyl-2-C-methyl-D-erythritol kinase
LSPARDIAAAKINLALHVRGRREDGRHDIETVFAFCSGGDGLRAEPSSDLSLSLSGPFASVLATDSDNLVLHAAQALRQRCGTGEGAALHLVKNLPVASGLGGGSADAAAALRLLTSLWRTDPAHASAVAPELGSDVPACLLSMSARGSGAGDVLELIEDDRIAGTPVLLVNPLVPLSTREVFERWDGADCGPLGDWREGRNDLEAPALSLVPQIGEVLDWLRARNGASFVRMSGSGASCFALFEDEAARDRAEEAVPREWWRLATVLR